jgi:hypothetical protein
MTLAAARLTFRIGRTELLAFGGVLVGLAIATYLSAIWVDSLRPPLSCLGGQEFDADCEVASQAWYAAQAGLPGLFAGLLLFVTFAAGLFLGVPIVAREVERGTTRLAWALSPSRMRWFGQRMLPVLGLMLLVAILAAFATERMSVSLNPTLDTSNAFVTFGYRGIPLAARAIFIFAVGVLVGAVVARTLPAIILGAIIAAIGLSGGQAVHQKLLVAEAVQVPVDMNGEQQGATGDMFIDQRFVLPDGTLVGYEYFGGETPFDDATGNPLYPMVNLVIPGTRYQEVAAREALALLGGALVGLLAAGFVVNRRRPG